MISSMHILAQRYLDGEMSDVERSAFLNDLASDPRVAEILEVETRLDMALVDDAFSIEPPAHLRSAVLETISSTHSDFPVNRFRRAVWSLAVGVMFFAAPTIHDRSVDVGRSFETVPLPVHPDHSTSVLRSSQSVVSTPEALANISVPSDAVQHDTQPLIDQPHHLITSANVNGFNVERPTTDVVHASVSRHSIYTDDVRCSSHQLSGVAAPAVASIRYNLNDNDDIRFYVESGVVTANLQSTVFTNGSAQYTSQRQLLPFAVVGAQGLVMSVPMLDRNIMGSLALGITSLGPVAMADVAMSVFQIGNASLDAGVRFIGAFDLRQRSATSMHPQPFLSVSLGL
jgi:hypothetical protein